MNKINRIFSTISISITLLLIIGISGTYLSDYLISIEWFGDYTKTESRWGEDPQEFEYWGARHYWYNWGVFLLFITSLARAVAKVIVGYLLRTFQPKN